MIQRTTYRDRKAWSIENETLRVTVTVEGGHIAEILHKPSGVNPLWSPPWPSIEPSTFDLATNKNYGSDAEAKLLAGILGHNLCLDIFGGPSAEEAAAGMTTHGEASVAPYTMAVDNAALVLRTRLVEARLDFERRIHLAANGKVVCIREAVTNLTALDRPVGWTQHATLGPPFLEKGKTQFRAPATRSKVYETDFAGDKGQYAPGTEFDWPNAPRKGGGAIDLRTYTNLPVSGGLTTHLLDPHRRQVFFVAWSPASKLAFGYVWKRTDFPWLAIWEENYSRTGAPWNGKTLTRGMEFGASPMPESRRQMIERGSLFGVPGYRWIPAKSTVVAEYCAFAGAAGAVPEQVEWDGGEEVRY